MRGSISSRSPRTRERASRPRSRISAAAAEGVQVDAAVTGLRLVGIEFDAKTLRIIAEAEGTARAMVTKLQ